MAFSLSSKALLWLFMKGPVHPPGGIGEYVPPLEHLLVSDPGGLAFWFGRHMGLALMIYKPFISENIVVRIWEDHGVLVPYSLLPSWHQICMRGTKSVQLQNK